MHYLKTTKFILGLILLIPSINVNGQTWINDGARWIFDYYGAGSTGSYTYDYTNDTIVEGIEVQAIKRTKYFYEYNGNTVITALGEMYTYHSNDSVFYWSPSNQQFFLLYDFGAEIGDSWVFGKSVEEYSCDSLAIAEVIDTGTMELNGESYRTITLQTISDSELALSGVFVEKFGLVSANLTQINPNMFASILPTHKSCGGLIVDYHSFFSFRCYSENGVEYYNPNNLNCGDLVNSQELSYKDVKIDLSPNPCSEQLRIEILDAEIIDMQLFDYSGKRQGINIQTKTTNQVELDIHALSAGIYWITIETPKGLLSEKFVKL